jgi:maltooligosyltrehalose trehalohydrolase
MAEGPTAEGPITEALSAGSGIDYQFGPRTAADGTTVFRLWAPTAGTVSLEVVSPDGEAGRHRMSPRGESGWYDSPALIAPPGTRYGFRINDEILVPDPAARMQETDVHGMSVVVASGPATPPGGPVSTPPHTPAHTPRRWEETVIYEAHVGTLTPEGTFRGMIAELPRLADTGITVLELLPVADFPGRYNWGYDGVLPFAPDRSYGTPEDLRALVAAAHDLGIDVWMDVVYNHFGPEGNYLHLYAAPFFSDDVATPWGAGIDFTVPEVRRFFIENALFWLDDCGLDGLRLDAVHAIVDPSPTHILVELARTVRSHFGPDREPHLVLENEANEAHFLRPPGSFRAQWNDDIHHALHVLLTGETTGYYADFAEDTEEKLLRALATGFVYQGEASGVHGGAPRGEPSGDLPPVRFVSFLQNHDQIGNRARGERLTEIAPPAALEAAQALLLLAPQIPMLFMGEEWWSTAPFLFFCDFDEDLTDAVRAGRRREFDLDDLPDPGAPETVTRSRPGSPGGGDLVRSLIDLRRIHLMPILGTIGPGSGTGGGERAISVAYPHADGVWCIDVNLSEARRPAGRPPAGVRREVYRSHPELADGTEMPPWSIGVYQEHS